MIPYLACMAAAAALNHLPPLALPAIQRVEGGKTYSVSLNTDGTEDLGLMQINSRWIASISLATRLTQVEARARLLEDPCWNIRVAGAILKIYLNEAHGQIWPAVGYYNSHFAVAASKYRLQVGIAAAELLNESIIVASP